MENLYRPERILSYVVQSDNGLAPNITGGFCTLAVCKPVVRRTARAGQDLVLGMSRQRNCVTYIMQVDRKVSFFEYSRLPEFECKKPSFEHLIGDNFFKEEAGELQLAFDIARHNGNEEALARDLNAPVVLVGYNFWYFGERQPELPLELHNAHMTLPGRRRDGHRVTTDGAEIAALIDWVHSLEPGIHGKPRDQLMPLPHQFDTIACG